MDYFVKHAYFFINLFTACYMQSYSTVYNLKKSLFSQYDKALRPVDDALRGTRVDVEFTLLSIDRFDEATERFTVSGLLTVIWSDSQLTWIPEDHENLEVIYVLQKEIWKPDIKIRDGVLGGDFPESVNLGVDYNGNVNLDRMATITTKCVMVVKHFPFDRQLCMLSFMTEAANVFIDAGIWNSSVQTLTENGEWSVLGILVRIDYFEKPNLVTYEISLKRKPLRLLLNLIIPTLLLAILNVFTFVIPAESGEKTGFCMTIFLSVAVFLTITSNQLPAHSDYLSYLDTWLLVILVEGGTIIILSTLQLRIHYREDNRPVPRCIQKFIYFSELFQFRHSCTSRCNRNKRDTTTKVVPIGVAGVNDKELKVDVTTKGSREEADSEKDAPTRTFTWKQLCKALDFFGFWICLIFLLLASVILLTFAADN